MTADQLKNYYGGVKAVCDALAIRERTFYHWKRYGIPLVTQKAIAWDTAGKLRPAADGETHARG